MKPAPLFKQIKIIPLLLLGFILINLSLSLYTCISSVNKTKILDVNIYRFKQRSYKSFDIGKNWFQTGTEGKLYWKVKNIKEAFNCGSE